MPAQNKIFYPLTHRYLIHFLVIIIALSTVTVNLQAKELSDENFGQKNLLASLIGRDATELIEETKVENNGSTITSYLGEDYTQQGLPKINDLSNKNLGQDITTITQGGAAIMKPTIAPGAKLPQARSQIEIYTVQQDDTISSIAVQFSVSINTILWENNLSSYSLIRPGAKLDILPVSGLTHKIVKNDTITKLTKKYDVEEVKIRDWNNLAPDATLQIGQKLIIPGGKKVVTRTTSRLSSWNSFVKPPSVSVPASEKMFWPVPASHRITQYYTWRHHAIDIGAPTGIPVYSAADGVVISAGWITGYGYQVMIDHGGGKRTRYGHFSKFYVEKGQAVKKGQVIGAIGSTGWSTGPHLHFEVIINGRKYNPLNYVR